MPEIGGDTAPGFEAVREALAAGLAGEPGTGAAVGVYLHGRKVVDLWGGVADPTSLTRRSIAVVTPPLDHNRPEEQAAEMPSTNGICTARALARFYAALIGEVDGHRILTPGTLAAATAEQASGMDRILRMPVRTGTGFGLPTPDAFWYSPTAFGFPRARRVARLRRSGHRPGVRLRHEPHPGRRAGPEGREPSRRGPEGDGRLLTEPDRTRSSVR